MTSIFLLLLFISNLATCQELFLKKEICEMRPAKCSLMCPHGYLMSDSKCLCTCARDPCQIEKCQSDEICVTSGITATCAKNQGSPRTECPRLTGVICTSQCESDEDCQGRLICCSNGCGTECVVPLTDFPITPKPISPVNGHFRRLITAVEQLPNTISSFLRPQTEFISEKKKIEAISSAKTGHCPNNFNDGCKQNVNACDKDDDCDGYQKCCSTSCGAKCLDPVKTTACVHFAMAVRKLPAGQLVNGYIPKCEGNGKFSPIQCDSTECWCVDVNYGTEIPGSRIELGMRRGDMCINLRTCAVRCEGSCSHGFLMDQFGCPLQGCICKDICHNVGCSNTADVCQLVEPDCVSPPCLPVPRCLVNPCPSGHPMTISTGVTALCVRNEQCSDNYWCHQIGYSGLGFCCSGQEPEGQLEGQCPSKSPLKNATCTSSCKTDEHCLNGKCCFDGCGLSCIETNETPRTTRMPLIEKKIEMKVNFQPDLVSLHNKEYLSSVVAECPTIPSSNQNCTTACSSDADCTGMKRCCRAGCSTVCTYFTRSTPCFQMSLTSEAYGLRKIRKCDRTGNFEQVQCDDNGCFCVDIASGDELPGTRESFGKPDCSRTKICENHDCKMICRYGYQTDQSGCPTCTCQNPCQDVSCPQGSMCVVTNVNCFQKENCHPQPRCVLSLCPTGEAALSPIGSAETCNNNEECPGDYWCHSFGLSSGGICCPNPAKPIHSGQCPPIQPVLDRTTQCSLECRADDDCPKKSKCCFDGCGTMCLETHESEEEISEEVKVITDFEKTGECPHLTEEHTCNKILSDECATDMTCPGVQKCCSDGCRKVCVYSERTTSCLQLKGALQQIGQMDRIKCRPDGSFEYIQCNSQFCWCVDRNGFEIEGTRSSEDVEPNCDERRNCPQPLCTTAKDCKFGLRKDSDGCNTCECYNPCEDVFCPQGSVCMPVDTDCSEEYCPQVPRCVMNPCDTGIPLMDSSTFELLICKDSRQCRGSNHGQSYCNVYRADEGLCCPGKEPKHHPGTCPRIMDSHTTDCVRRCTLDEHCSSDEKCCSNGCGMTCQPAEFDTPVHAIVHIGECLPVRSLGAFCSQRGTESECKTDSDCSELQKCCSDGCSMRCTSPYITTQCVHSRLAALALVELNPQIMLPECDSSGEFIKIQKHYGLRWCVDEHGNEIPGTKSVGNPICQHPKSCPVRSCDKHCPLGYKTDNDGCVVCDCRDYCEFVECAAGTVCRMVETACIASDCQPVPRCVPNMCSVGEPLSNRESGTLAECSVHADCPTNYHCKKNGFLGKGVCCQGLNNQQTNTLQCPAMSHSNSSIDGSPCVISCRHPSDCSQSICCFNGCGTSCQFHTSRPISPTNRPVKKMTKIHPIQLAKVAFSSMIESIPSVTLKPVTVLLRNSTITTVPAQAHFPVEMLSAPAKVGTCPSLLLNPGCKEECLADADCEGFMKCCRASCAAVCVPPKSATYCVHALHSLLKESPSPDIPLPIQCSNDGLFRRHQCDAIKQQCWCVDEKSGREVIGTRQSSLLSLPNCKRPRICSANCHDALLFCPYGLRLDSEGCPLNGICVCRNPCQDIKCLSPLSICVLQKKDCIGHHCPSIPTCIPNLCGLNSVVTEEFGNPRTCLTDNECGHDSARCIKEKQGDEQISMCCQAQAKKILSTATSELTTPYKRLRRPSACSMLRNAIDSLINKGATVGIVKPACADSGAFNSIQCDVKASCWCVDTNTGQEIPGTRRLNAIGEDVCSNYHTCSSKCSENLCPFGLLLDLDGCPSSDCKCSSVCDKIICKNSEICLVRTKVLDSEKYVSIPTCQKSPCPNGREPALDLLTRQRFSCTASTVCPNGYQCVSHESTSDGFCCPIKNKIKEKTKLVKTISAARCAHGDPFSILADGTPATCTASANGCPSTHYCSTAPGKNEGICCVSKRHVCNLASSTGSCALSTERFYYSATKHKCIPFIYGGCSGNLNNFLTIEECQQFCQGIGIDLTSPFMDNDEPQPVESYQLGFLLNGPLSTTEQKDAVIRRLKDYLTDKFGISTDSINNFEMKNDKSVRFTVRDVRAGEISRLISESIGNGALSFDVNSVTYRAEPQTLFAHQIGEEQTESATTKIVFWAVIIAAGIFAVIVIIIICVAFIFLYRSSAKDASSLRSSTPSNFVSHSIVAHRAPPQPTYRTVTNQYQNPSNPTNQRLRREMIFSREDLHRAHQNQSTNPNERPQSVIYY